MKKRDSSRFRVIVSLLVFFAAAFLLSASRTGDAGLYLLAAAVPGCMMFLLLLPFRLLALDRPSLAAAMALCGLGILAPAALLPDEALSQGMRCLAALFFLLAGAVLVRTFRPSVPAAAIGSVCALALFFVPLLIPEMEFSFSQGGTALLLIAVSAFLALRTRLPALAVSLAGFLLLLLFDGLSSAAVWSIACILLFWACSGSGLWSGILLLGISGLWGGWFAFVPRTVELSENLAAVSLADFPLLPPESVMDSGTPGTNSLFSLLGSQYGLILLLCAFLLLLFLLLRSASVALQARKSFHASLAFGVLLLFGVQALIFMLELSCLIPCSGTEFPLLTGSLPDLCAQFFLLGLLSGVSVQNEADLSEDMHLSMLAR